MSGGGRGAALRKLLENKDKPNFEPSHPPPQPSVEVPHDVPIVRRSVGRGAQFAKLMQARGLVDVSPDSSKGLSAISTISKDASPVETKSPGRSFRSESPVSSLASEMTEMSVQDPPVVMKGTSGESLNFHMNYIRLQLEPGKGVFEYEVKFKPDVESRKFRRQCLNQHSCTIGETKSFDGTILFLPYMLPDKVTNLRSELPSDNSNVDLTIIFKKKKFLGESIQLYNVLFRQIMNHLGLVLMGRNFFDPSAGKPIPAHRLEVWPGYITAIDEYEGGIMLMCDASHRVLRTTTVFEQMSDMQSVMEENEWKKAVIELVVGKSVLTRYNNKTYRIDDISWDQTPLTTFEYAAAENSVISFVDYYKKVYGIKLLHMNQPLLVSHKKTRVKGVETPLMVLLLPELCYITGLTDDVRADFKVMKDVAEHTRINPNQRHSVLKRFIKNVNSNETTRKILSCWGLTLEDGTVGIPGRTVHPENIYFGCKKIFERSYQADWTRGASSNPVLSPAELKYWIIIYPRREEKCTRDLVRMMMNNSSQLGIVMNEPEYVSLNDDRSDNYVSTFRNKCRGGAVQMVVFIMLAQRADKYSAIKKMCCVENPIPSQVVLARTIKKYERLRAVSLKILLQLNCKLGGSLWAVQIPFKNAMCVGIDTYHDPLRKKASIAAIVSSTNESFTQWFSKISKQEPGKELIHGLIAGFVAGLMHYQKVNGRLPDQVLIYRDGVGDGDLKYCKEFEIPQLQKACRLLSYDYDPKFLFVVVGKRVNTRMFLEQGNKFDNPSAGSIIDHTVTRRNWYDFFLVSQNIRIGTATPTHYIVIHNTTSMTPDRVQILTYKLCHLYYNFSATIRVPAPCQYAHKLAYLVGEYIHLEPDDSLTDKLFFL